MSRVTPAGALYRLLMRLLPARVRAADGAEMAEAFDALWRDGGVRRLRTWLVSFGGLIAVIVLEWRDVARPGRGAPDRGPRRGGRMSAWWRMVRHGARSLRRSPAFTASVVLLLGLGVGSVSAIYAVVDHVLLRPLPYPAVDRLFEVQNGSHSGPAFEEFQRMRSVEMWAAVMTADANLTGEGDPLRVLEASVSPDFFALFGARPAVGRLFVAEDFRSGEGVVLSYGAWQRVWGGDAGVVGRTIRIDGTPAVVVGVVDRAFTPPEALTNPETDLWRPIDPAYEDLERRGHHVLSVAGRLEAGATLADAAVEAERMAEDRARAFPEEYVGRDGSIATLPVVALQEATVGRVRRGLGLLFGAVTLLLLVACANVTHLFLARGVARVREMSVRRALGAGTGALAGQLLVESLLLGSGGAVLGVALAQAALRAFVAVNPGGLPRVDAVAIDVRVAAFAALVGAVTAVVFGLVPALRLAGGSVADVLRTAGRSSTGSRGAQATRTGIVIAEVALSLVLIAQAGWLLRSFVRLQQQPLGFSTADVLTIPLTPTAIEEPEEWQRRMEGIRRSLAETPGVRSASFGLSLPLEFTGGGRCCWSTRITFPGAGESPRQMLHPVDADYFGVFDLQILAGRSWSRAEVSAVPRPAVVTEPLAVQMFGSAAAAVGRTFDLNETPFHVIGVAADNRHYGADEDHGPAVYLPVQAMPFVPTRVHMAVRTAGAQPDIATRLRAAVWRAEPHLPVPTIRAMSDWARVATAQSRFESALFVVFSAVALLLLAGGLSGTLLYTVSLQRRDLGIRLALGATAARLERRVLLRGFAMAATGAALGAAGAWATGRLIESRLFGVDARDLRTLALATALLLLTALASSWVPARRAARTDPMESLRME